MSALTAPPTAALPREYLARRERLREQYAAIPAGAPVRLAKRSSNLFRPRAPSAGPGLDVAAFDGVLSVDPEARTAEVQGMTTYEHLVDATLPHGLMPLVVPQLKTITLGGAVTGLGIESTSFRNGCPHESVLELEVMTGDGRIVVARPDNEHADLYWGFPNSYGTLGYALRLRIELEPVAPYLHLRHLPFPDAGACMAALARMSEERAWEGEAVDFLDGVAFAPGAAYVTAGSFVDEPGGPVSDYTGERIFYRSIPRLREDWLTVRDYLWRWDTDWFWHSGTFGLTRPRLRRMWPKRWLRSDAYWKLIALERRHGIVERLDRARGAAEREYVIQDVEVPVDRAAEFLAFLQREVRIAPVWLCPLRVRRAEAPWTLYALEPGTTYVNFGFWGRVELPPGAPDGTCNRRIEEVVAELGGRKSLYSTAFYPPDEFRAIYGGDAYDELKAAYDPEGRLLDLYEKCVEGR